MLERTGSGKLSIESSSAIIIGSGIAGLTTAYKLQNSGYSVSLFERGRRRQKELKKYGKKVTLKEIIKSLKKRDESDKNRTRKQGKLEKTKESQLINTTHLSINEGFLKVKSIIDRKLKKKYGRNYKTG